MTFSVRYDYGYNNSGTGQHEVIEYVTTQEPGPTCRCIHPEHHSKPKVEEGPYVVLYTEKPETARVIAALLNVDGTDQNWPNTPMAEQYAKTAGGIPWRPWDLPHYRDRDEKRDGGYPNSATALHD
jgi:hypothetical protein